MGACCGSPITNINEYITAFIEELKISNLTFQEFISFIDANPANKDNNLTRNTLEFLGSISQNEVHTIFERDVLKAPKNLLFASLIFLVKAENKDMADNYTMIINRIKMGQIADEEIEKFRREYSEFSILREVLVYYIRLVSLMVLNAVASVKNNLLTEEYLKTLNEMYADNFINSVADDLLKGFSQFNLDLKVFFTQNEKNLKHVEIRNLLEKKYQESLPKNTEKKNEDNQDNQDNKAN